MYSFDDIGQSFIVSTIQYSKVPDTDESKGQDVQAEAPDKLLFGQRHNLYFSIFAIIFVFEEDLLELSLWQRISKGVNKKYTRIDKDKKRYQTVKSLINIQVTDVIRSIESKLNEIKPNSYLDIKKLDKRIAGFSQDMLSEREPLRKLLLEKFYRHYRVVRMSSKAKRFIKRLFDTYMENSSQLPLDIQKRIKKGDSLRRTVCDYIAGMTDRSVLDEYKKLFNPYTKV